MGPKTCLLSLLLLAALLYQVHAEFYFSHVFPKPEDVNKLNLKCAPGRTVIKMLNKSPEPNTDYEEEEDDNRSESPVPPNALRSHMSSGLKETYCQVCVCSVEGKDEYCSHRPAANVNECLRMTKLVEEFRSNEPFDHTRGLPFRIRRGWSGARDRCS